jgi:UDP-N-acetylmuramoyl-L-alanyl-D-glutamate--2,6-diaminopimelate ligase
VLQVSDSKKILSRLAAAYYQFPSKEMKVVGVTGTNGKTTITYLLEQVFQEKGMGILGTINYRVGDRVVPATQTTPGALEVQAFLREMVDAGCRYAAVEVSSHALDQCRVADVDFQVAIFTNLSQDHLDYHQTMEAYAEAKLKLFTQLRSSSWAIVNVEDPLSQEIMIQTKARLLTYGFGQDADVRAEAMLFGTHPIKMDVTYPVNVGVRNGMRNKITIQPLLIGRHNVYNILASFAASLVLNRPPAQIKQCLERLRCVPGRLEAVGIEEMELAKFNVFVDYAHTPDGLSQVLTTLREITPGRLLVVFGCGGDRDRGKRPEMGRIAAQLADEVFITSDNPRSEDPKTIIQDMIEGIRPLGEKKMSGIKIEADRSAAIREAIFSAGAGDTVLLAGKGHENYQIFKDVTVPFDDRDQARRWMTEKEARHVSVG